MAKAKRKTKEEKALEEKVLAAADKAIATGSISIMDIEKIMDAGYAAAKAGQDVDAACLAEFAKYNRG